MSDQPDEWGTPKRGRKSEKRQRSAVVSVRMTQDELARVQAKAQAVGQTIGTYMRNVALSDQPDDSGDVEPPLVALIVSTRHPEKWELIDHETGQHSRRRGATTRRRPSRRRCSAASHQQTRQPSATTAIPNSWPG